jgi:hypothetical protein
MLYSTADTTDIEGGLMMDVNEIEHVGSTDAVNMVAQVDRTDTDPSWTDARRFLLTQDGDWQTVNSEVVESLGEVNQGDPQTLVDFVLWATSNFPADHYALILSDHGGAWTGFGWDVTSGSDPLTLMELDAAFAAINANMGRKLDIIGFDACLMAQYDVMKLLSYYADYAILSEETIPGYGWAYDLTLPHLVDNPAMAPADLSQQFVTDYIYSYTEGEWIDLQQVRIDLSVIDLNQMPTVEAAIANFAQVMDANSAEMVGFIGDARNNALYFGGSTPNEADSMSSVDLVNFLQTLITLSDNTEVNDAAQSVIDAVGSVVINHQYGPALTDSKGMTVFFPRNPMVYREYGHNYPTDVPFTTEWQGFLDSYYAEASAIPALASDAVAIIGVYPSGAVSIHKPPVVIFATNGQNIVDVSFVAILVRDDGTAIMLDKSSLSSAEVGPEGEELIDFPDGLQTNEFAWGAEMPVVTDGVVSIPTLLQTDPENSDVVMVSGLYMNNVGEVLNATLAFDIETKQMTSGWGISEGSSAPFALSPQPGEQFVPLWRSLDADGNWVDVPASSDPLTFGAEPFSYHYEPAASGQYAFLIRMEDIAGNVSMDQTMITIDNEGLDINYRGYTDIDMGINFLYPWEWPSPTFYLDDEGSYQAVISDANSDINIYVTAYEAASDQDAYDAMIGYLDSQDVQDMAYDETNAEAVTIDGYEGTVIPYSFTIDGALHYGLVTAVYVPDLETGFVIDLDVIEELAGDGEAILNVMLGSMNFFAPPEM